jgi:hypothetical protein
MMAIGDDGDRKPLGQSATENPLVSGLSFAITLPITLIITLPMAAPKFGPFTVAGQIFFRSKFSYGLVRTFKIL